MRGRGATAMTRRRSRSVQNQMPVERSGNRWQEIGNWREWVGAKGQPEIRRQQKAAQERQRKDAYEPTQTGAFIDQYFGAMRRHLCAGLRPYRRVLS